MRSRLLLDEDRPGRAQGGGDGLAQAPRGGTGLSENPDPAPLPRRPLGRTGFSASVIGAGDVADRKLGTQAGIAVLERAVGLGVNLLDTAPSYEDGLSELIVGHVARARPRHLTFVIDKVDHPRAPILAQVDASSLRMRLEPIDLVVFHGIETVPDLERLLARGGGFDQLDEGKKHNLLRFTGASCHHPEVASRLIDSGRADVVMFPLGPFVDPRYRPLVARAREKGVGTVCFKTFGAGKLLGPTTGYGKPLAAEAPEEARRMPTRLDAARCIRYTMTLDPDVTLLGMSTVEEVETALAAARDFTPMSAAEMAATEADAALEVRGKGKIWWDPASAT